MEVYKRHSTDSSENGRLLREIREEVMQLRAATQVYTALLERLLASDAAFRAALANRQELCPPLKEAS